MFYNILERFPKYFILCIISKLRAFGQGRILESPILLNMKSRSLEINFVCHVSR